MAAKTLQRELNVDAFANDAVARTAALLSGPGAAVLRRAIDLDGMTEFLSDVEHAYELFALAIDEHGIDGAAGRLPSGVRCQPTAAAIGLDGIDGWQALFDNVSEVVFDVARARLNGAAALDVDICWLRRQYPPQQRPEGQSPHGFHQDGAYGFDFLATNGRGNLLPMVTAWIPLCASGSDAPGLELVPAELHQVLSLDELAPNAIDERWPPNVRVRPVTTPGDIVVMSGHHLHRTYATEGMTRSRTCVELRFVPRETAFAPLIGHALVDVPGRS